MPDTIDNLMELNALSVLAIFSCECTNNNEIINQLIAGLSITTSSMLDTRASLWIAKHLLLVLKL